MEKAIEPARPRRGALLVLVQVLVALGATLGYLVFIATLYGYAPAWPLNGGCAILLGLLWWLAVRGGRGMMKPGLVLGLLGFGGIVAGDALLVRAEAGLRAELNACRYQRLASAPDKSFNEEDDFGKELEKAFGPSIAYENRPMNWTFDLTSTAKAWEPNPDAYEAMAKRVEDRKPGWPRILRAFSRMGIGEHRSLERDQRYYGYVQVACGHYFSGTREYGVLQAYIRAEHRVMKLAEADREIFLKAWKNRPVER